MLALSSFYRDDDYDEGEGDQDHRDEEEDGYEGVSAMLSSFTSRCVSFYCLVLGCFRHHNIHLGIGKA